MFLGLTENKISIKKWFCFFWACWSWIITIFNVTLPAEAAERAGRCEASVYSRLGSDTNRFHLAGTFGDGNLSYVLLSDDSGAVELTLQNNSDTFIWRRGSSNSWTLYIAGNREMLSVNKSFNLNHDSFRWFALQEALRVSGVEQFQSRLDPDVFRILHPERGESFSTQRIDTNGLGISYFDISKLGDGTRITNLAGNASIVAKPAGMDSVELIVFADSCFASRVFTNVVAELSARFRCSYREAMSSRYPSVSTNYGMVIDFRTGVRTEYGLPYLTDSSWPIDVPPTKLQIKRRSNLIMSLSVGLLLIPGVYVLLTMKLKRKIKK